MDKGVVPSFAGAPFQMIRLPIASSDVAYLCQFRANIVRLVSYSNFFVIDPLTLEMLGCK